MGGDESIHKIFGRGGIFFEKLRRNEHVNIVLIYKFTSTLLLTGLVQYLPGSGSRMILEMEAVKVYITSVGVLNVCNLWILLKKIVIYLVGRKCRLHVLFRY